MAPTRIRGPVSDQITDLTDWLESCMLVEGYARMSRSRLRRYIRDAAAWNDDELEVYIDLVLQEAERRERIAGTIYPFARDGSGLRVHESDTTLAYVFLLCLSSSEPLRAEKRHTSVEQLLDFVVLDALKCHLSTSSRGLHFGWPRSGAGPPGFRDALKWLAAHLGLKLRPEAARAARKDAGVDVVVWRPFKDDRAGYVTFLAQCTIALDWVPKAKDIATDLWRRYIDFGKDPVICLAIPFVIPNPFDQWDDVRCDVHFVLDRLRLCELLEGVELSNKPAIEAWTESELKMMGRA